MNTESVKINSKTVARVRKRVKKHGETISGFINIAINERLDRIEQSEKVVSILSQQLEKQNGI